MNPLHILVTNDDGIDSPGLRALVTALAGVGRVSVIAPDRNRSGVARSITIREALHVHEVEMAGGLIGYATDGTPVDCVRFAHLGLIGDTPDIVVSGINIGLNLGDDVTYSGTVAAGLEGVLLGWPAIAVSQQVGGAWGDENREGADFRTTAEFVARLVPHVAAADFPEGILLNVNAPSPTNGSPAGAEVTRLGRRIYNDGLRLEAEVDGRRRYRIYGDDPSHQPADDTDFAALERDRISLTPMRFDLTDPEAGARLAELPLDGMVAEARA